MTHSYPTRRSSDLGSAVSARGRSGRYRKRSGNNRHSSGAGAAAVRSPSACGPWAAAASHSAFPPPSSPDDEARQRASSPAAPARADSHSADRRGGRSEEHTSELQSLMRISYAVFCLKKKKKKQTTMHSKTLIHIHHEPENT